MKQSHWAITDEGSAWLLALTLGLTAFSILLLALELRGAGRRRWLSFFSGLAATAAIALAVLRPARIDSLDEQVGGRVDILVDQSRRLLLPTENGTRLERSVEAVVALRKQFPDARLRLLGFSEGPLRPWKENLPRGGTMGSTSDLSAALQALELQGGERAQAVVIVSDGQFVRPAEGSPAGIFESQLRALRVPLHTVRVEESVPNDVSIRSVRSAGAAVAHQRMALTVDVGCNGSLDCERVAVEVRELKANAEPTILATGIAEIRDGMGSVELEITLDLAGSRVVEISLAPTAGDMIPENDTRVMTFAVARERIRLLHLAGRPTYDVRALRRWLKSDKAVDIVAFFILRDSEGDDHRAPPREMALIEFPVHELFTEHLNSFDAVILQDIDAVKYKLDRYLAALTKYVKNGHGLIMVGGPSSFAGGNYAGTDLDEILPVEPSERSEPFDSKPFVPLYTPAGRAAVVTHSLRELMPGSLPSMMGTNFLGKSRPGTIVLWEHPTLMAGEKAMPILALGEAGAGRSIALSVDATHRLAFGQQAAGVAGRAYGALWDGLLGWLMRNPRYEAARIAILGPCIEGQETKLQLTRLPGMKGDASITISRLGLDGDADIVRTAPETATGVSDLSIPGLRAGGYTVRAQVGASPPTRTNFACDKSGTSWADSRPDPERLQAIAGATGGVSVTVDRIDVLPAVDSSRVSAERKSSPFAPPWIWTLASACLLGLHWLTRRSSGAL